MATNNARPVEPVAPDGMEMLFFYKCPFCGGHTGFPSPVEPRMVSCEHCHKGYPIIPVDEAAIQYLRIMLAGGAAAVDPDFI